MPQNQEFALALKSMRIDLRMTQEAISKALKVQPGTYRAWEAARVLPNFENFEKINTFCVKQIGIQTATDIKEKYKKALIATQVRKIQRDGIDGED